jgi:hypothetical protein
VQKRSITQITTSRPDLFAFEVKGRIHQDDIEWMARILQAAFDSLGEVDIIIVMKEWEGIDPSAAFDPQSLWAQARANAHVRHYAVVGAPGWAKAMINVLSPLTPVKEKTFDLPREAEAWRWVDGAPMSATA